MDPPLDSPESCSPSRDSPSPPSESRSSEALGLAPSSKTPFPFKFDFRKAIAEYKLKEKWEASPAGKKFAQKAKRANLSDFDRFTVMIKRKNRSFNVRKLAKKVNVGGGKGNAKKAPAKQPAAKKGK